MNQESHSVLLVSDDSKIISQIKAFLIAPLFNLTVADDFYEASRMAEMRSFDFIIIDSADGSGTDFSINICETDAVLLLLVSSEKFDEISYRVESYGILTIAKPFEPFYFYNMMKIAIAVKNKIRALTSQTIKLKSKMEEIRLVNRAKLLLIEKQGLSEQEAHRYLEKQSMDSGQKRTSVAEEVIKRLS